MVAVAGSVHRSRGLGPLESFERRVQRGATEDDCWTWIGHIGSRGYGTFETNGKRRSAHRVSYEMHHGEIPEGLVVMHSCDNRRCVNPRHLSVGTSRANTLDMMAKERHASFRQTHCASGHEFTEANTLYRNDAGKRFRMCRTCNAARCAANREAEKRVVDAVVAMLRAQYDEAQARLATTREKAMDPSYSIGERDTLGIAADDIERGDWRKYLALAKEGT